MHILNKEHDCGPINTMDFLQSCEKSRQHRSRRNYYIQEYQAKGQLLVEQFAKEVNVLLSIIAGICTP